MSKVVYVRDFMVTRVVTLSPDQDIFQAMKTLIQQRFSGAPVVDAEQRLVGMLSEKDCLRVFASGAYYYGAGGHVSDYMSKAVATVDPDDELFKVADIFMSQSFRRLPVVEDGKLVGQISRRDVLMASLKICEDSPIKPPFTDSKFISDDMKAVLNQGSKPAG